MRLRALLAAEHGTSRPSRTPSTPPSLPTFVAAVPASSGWAAAHGPVLAARRLLHAGGHHPLRRHRPARASAQRSPPTFNFCLSVMTCFISCTRAAAVESGLTVSFRLRLSSDIARGACPAPRGGHVHRYVAGLPRLTRCAPSRAARRFARPSPPGSLSESAPEFLRCSQAAAPPHVPCA
eukprot:1539149-Pleurochrysis_carterae.AAC.1